MCSMRGAERSKSSNLLVWLAFVMMALSLLMSPTYSMAEELPDDYLTAAVEAQVGTNDGYTSNDDLLTGYVQQLLEEQVPGEDEFLLTAQSVGYQLEGKDAEVYSLLDQFVQDVAAGERPETVFSMPMADLSDKLSWTEDELGCEIVVDGRITQEAMSAVGSLINPNMPLIMQALLAERPYELYWYDKTTGYTYGSLMFGASYDGSEWTLYVTNDTYEIEFCVCNDYAAGNFLLDTTQIDRVHTAIENAAQTATEEQRDDAYATMAAYKDAICDYVNYDFDALGDDVSYGDPWQLINVFDGDESTNVVCEGYSKAFQYLCDLGLSDNWDTEVYCVSGTMAGGTGAGPHMWNLARMADGRVYLIDVTNCDEDSVGYPDLLFVAIPSTGSLNEGYGFDCDGMEVTYDYDEDTRWYFSQDELTLSTEEWGGAVVSEQFLSEQSSWIEQNEYPYTGEPVMPQLTVQDESGNNLIEDYHYTVVYLNGYGSEIEGAPIEPGSYGVMARAIQGNGYQGDGAICEFTILAPATTVDVTLNMPLTIQVVHGDTWRGAFTAPSSGTYYVLTSGDGPALKAKVVTDDEDENVIASLEDMSSSIVLPFQLEEGQSVCILLDNWTSNTGSSIFVVRDESRNLASMSASLANDSFDAEDGDPMLVPSVTDATGTSLMLDEDYQFAYFADESCQKIDELPFMGGTHHLNAAYEGIGSYFGVAYIPFDYFVPYDFAVLPNDTTNISGNAESYWVYTAMVTTDYTLQITSSQGTVPYEVYADDHLQTLMATGSVSSGNTDEVQLSLVEGQSIYIHEGTGGVQRSVSLTMLCGKDISTFSGSIPTQWCPGNGSIQVDHTTVSIFVEEGAALTYGEDFVFSYIQNVGGRVYRNELSMATTGIAYTGTGQFRGTLVIPVEVCNSLSLQYGSASLESGQYVYTGEPINVGLEVQDRQGNVLVPSTDYVIRYYDETGTALSSAPVYVGTYVARAEGIGGYSDLSSAVTFSIVFEGTESFDLQDAEVTVGSTWWTGQPAAPEPMVSLCGKILSADTDYDVEYAQNVDIGMATLTVTGKGAYSGSQEKSFLIKGSIGSSATAVTLSQGTYLYTGEACLPDVTVTFNGVELERGVDYTVTYQNNVAVGSASVVVSGMGDYASSKSVTYQIVAVDLTRCEVTLEKTSYVYSGSAAKPKVTVTQDGLTLSLGTHYTVSYQNNVNAGTAKALIKGIGEDAPTVEAPFTIGKATQTITTTKTAYSLVMGKTVALGAKRTKGNGKLTYASSNTAVAKVGTTGTVTPVKVGKVTITITAAETANYKKATKNVTVTVAKGTQAITASNKNVQVTKTVNLAAKTNGNGKLTYKSSNTAVATVNAKGVVTGKKVGTAKITITAAGTTDWNKATKTIIVYVKNANTMTAKATASTVTVKYSKTTARTTSSSNITIGKAKGTVTYVNASTNATAKKFTVNKTTGKVTVPKGTAKGTYQVIVKVTAAGNSTYLPVTKTVKYYIKVS